MSCSSGWQKGSWIGVFAGAAFIRALVEKGEKDGADRDSGNIE